PGQAAGAGADFDDRVCVGVVGRVNQALHQVAVNQEVLAVAMFGVQAGAGQEFLHAMLSLECGYIRHAGDYNRGASTNLPAWEPCMRSYEILREAAEKVGVKVLAKELKLSPALVYKWCEAPEEADPESSGAKNPLDRICEVVRLTNHTPVVNWLCHEAGGFFV